MSRWPQTVRASDSDGMGSARVDNAQVGRTRVSVQGLGAREGAEEGVQVGAEERARVLSARIGVEMSARKEGRRECEGQCAGPRRSADLRVERRGSSMSTSA